MNEKHGSDRGEPLSDSSESKKAGSRSSKLQNNNTIIKYAK